ncbi:MAG: hypothetical protein EOO12_08620 [Chitinophagaceae bacterium]|nr:MAG: hypothetical protein EOO12_08620 [Chitinophagaceae bacterium]
MRSREHNERNEAARPQRPQEERGRRSSAADFWDRIADDAASGYGAQRGRDRNILNPDQEPDDARRGDE